MTSPSPAQISRPRPPAHVIDRLNVEDLFVPSPELERWIRSTFIDPEGPLANFDHDHLNSAVVGLLWTNARNITKQIPVVGMAEIPKPPSSVNKWLKARITYQVRGFFGCVPDFVITLDALYAEHVSDTTFCALVEHELYHCAQAVDLFGCPKFTKGRPVFTIRGHDVEEFVGVVRRYGARSAAGHTMELVEAALAEPEIGAAEVSGACGTCLSGSTS